MTDIGLLASSSALFGTRRKKDDDTANGSLDAGTFQQQLGQALGQNNPAVQQQSATDSSDTRKVGMAAPQSSVTTYQAAQNAEGSGTQAFMDYMSMPLAQKMFFMVLAGMGVTKEQYDAMSPQEKQDLASKVEDKIKQMASTSGTPSADKTSAQDLRSAPVEQAGNTAKTRDGLDNADSLLQL